MTVVNMKGQIVEEPAMKIAFSDPNKPIFYHGDTVQFYERGKGNITGKIWWRSYGNEPRGISPKYGVLPEGKLSAIDSITASQDIMKLVKESDYLGE